jgi:hypothetical protein
VCPFFPLEVNVTDSFPMLTGSILPCLLLVFRKQDFCNSHHSRESFFFFSPWCWRLNLLLGRNARLHLQPLLCLKYSHIFLYLSICLRLHNIKIKNYVFFW